MARSPRGGVPRREALRRLAATTGGAFLSASAAQAADAPTKETTPAARPRSPWDPDLRNPPVSAAGTLSASERETLTALVDVILPADERSPAASRLGAPAFIDEWVSAPYPTQQADAAVVRGGLAWLNTESEGRFGKRFEALSPAQQHALCDDICFAPRARPEHLPGAVAFDRIRSLTLICYATSDEGMRDIGYVGNRPQATFESVPIAIRRRLKIP